MELLDEVLNRLEDVLRHIRA